MYAQCPALCIQLLKESFYNVVRGIVHTRLKKKFFAGANCAYKSVDTNPIPSDCIRQMKKIENADNYALTDAGIIYNLTTSRPVRKYWNSRNQRECSRITNNQGQRVTVYLDSLDANAASVPLSDDLLPLDRYPDYRITSYGAVWRVKDKRSRQPTLMRVFSRGEHDYVQLFDENGKRRTVNVRKLLAQAERLT